MSRPALAADTPTFQMKGAMFPLSVLYLMDADLEAFAAQLAERVELAPQFFRNNPVIVDLSQRSAGSPLDYATLYRLIKRFSMVPVGLRGGSENEKAAAAQAGFNILNDAKPGSERKAAEPPPPPAPRPTVNPTLVVDQAVRSGHQIYARGGDLVVLAPVNPGAEILADGNIHVYAPLRGRALAGVSGNTNARIFSDSLEAELISIAGRYQLSEDLPSSTTRKRVAIRLLDDKLHYDVLG
ncbi:MAG: septum site-determining protein MinC [Gammaproteobacteria bacterium]|nr:septum site-determining protein MinC [Gammaproteobacteria bacterium]